MTAPSPSGMRKVLSEKRRYRLTRPVFLYQSKLEILAVP